MAVTRTNLCTNPSMETGTTGWAGNAATLSNPTDGGFSGSRYARATATAATAFGVNGSVTIPVTAGQDFAFSAYVRGTTSRSAQLRATWTGATATTGTLTALASTTVWGQRLTHAGVVPVGATAVRIDVVTSAGAIGNVLDVDAVLVRLDTQTVEAYGDGSFLYWAWTGTAHASTSVETIGGLELVVLTDAPCPRVGITVDALDPSGPSVVRVWRSSPGGKRRLVRGWRARTVVGADYAEDFEVPLARVVTYELEVVSGALVPAHMSGQVTVDSDTGYVQDPLVPGTAVSIERVNAEAGPVLAVPSFRNLVNSIGMSVTAILGSDEPVALAGQRLAHSGVEFTLVTDAAEVSTALRTVLRTAFPVCIRPLPSWGPLPDVIYLAPPDIVEQPLGAVLGGSLTRWMCGGDTVAPPSMSILVPIWTYADVAALWATYAEEQAAATTTGATYLAVLKDPTMGGA